MFFFHSILFKKAAQIFIYLASGLLFDPLSQKQFDGQLQVLSFFHSELSPLQKDLIWLLENQPAARFSISNGHNRSEQDLLLNDLYSYNNVQPYWVTEYGPKEKASILLSELAKVDADGLDPARYHLQDLTALLNMKDRESLARLDVMLTLVLSTYLKDMYLGQAAPFHFNTTEQSREKDIPQLVLEGLNSPDLAAFLAAQVPQHREYQALKALLAQYRQLEFTGGWPQIPDGPTIRPGMVDKRLDLLAQRLQLSGDLPRLSPPVYVDISSDTLPLTTRLRLYDEELVKAVKRFQCRCNLEQDGSVGPKTLAALNMPVQEQVEKILLNMDRWRRLPHQLTGHHLLVNIASFDLAILNNGQAELIMPVIVGKEDHETPVFSHAMRYIEVNPYWTIPPSIVRKEIVKKMQQDPSYLRRQRIRVFTGWSEHASEISPSAINWYTIGSNIRRYRLRQDSGKGNALGTIKFMFPNRKNIYLHDTPGHNLFQRTKRAFSHGCVRVSRPLDLAVQILKDDGQNVSKERLQKQIASGKQVIFSLKHPLPIHLAYLTVRVSEDGTIHFYEDIYGRDDLLAKALLKTGRKKE